MSIDFIAVVHTSYGPLAMDAQWWGWAKQNPERAADTYEDVYEWRAWYYQGRPNGEPRPNSERSRR